jgi:RNA polymerase sigma factor (sigma-70 family)
MATGSEIKGVGGAIRRLFGGGSASGVDEADLLRRFANDRDPLALEVLVARHGPMVLGVCRRVLGQDRHSSEDAFQATFLVLARRAGSIRDPARLGPWLHGVAHRVAVRARSDLARRNARERNGAEVPAMATVEPDSDRAELRLALDEEVRRLPEKFRDPIVLCYLDGLTHDEAASRLRCPVGTIRSRLSTGRAKLRDRLTRRGVAVPSGIFGAVLTAQAAEAAVSPSLLVSTVTAATAFAGGLAGVSAAGMVSASVASLAESVCTTMILTKLKILGALALASMLTLGLGTVAAYQVGGPGQQPKVEKAEKVGKPADEVTEASLKDLKAQVEQAQAELARLAGEFKKAQARVRAAQVRLEAQMPTGMDAQLRSMGGMGGRSDIGGGVNKLMAYQQSSLATIQADDYVIVHKPLSDKVVAYSTATGAWTSYEVPQDVEVLPVSGPGIVALRATGEVRQIAVFAPSLGRWFPIDLKEPIRGKAIPIVGPGQVFYAIGRRVYAFSVTVGRWGVLELPEGAKPEPVLFPSRTTVEHDNHIYIFSVKTGLWTDFDTKARRSVVPAEK